MAISRVPPASNIVFPLARVHVGVGGDESSFKAPLGGLVVPLLREGVIKIVCRPVPQPIDEPTHPVRGARAVVGTDADRQSSISDRTMKSDRFSAELLSQ